MNILFTLCGRAGSKGCKNKNIKPFLGKPLFNYTLNAINEYKKQSCNHVFIAVSTDSLDFMQLLKANKEVFVIHRKASLSEDATPKVSVIKDALHQSEKHFKTTFPLVVDLDITSPIRTVDDIDKAISKQIDTGASCVFSVTKARRNPYFNMVKEEGGVVLKVLQSDYTARQQAPKMYDMNASIYAYKREFLLSDAVSPLHGTPQFIEMADTGIIDIDDEEDFELMEVIAKHLSIKKEYAVIFK